MGYRTHVLKGLRWNGLLRVASKAAVFFKVIVAYRFLSPREVGLYGLALIALGLLEQLTETGVNVIIVKEKKPLSYYIDTAFLVSIGRGIIIALILLASAFFLPSFFRDNGLFSLLLLASIIPFIRGFINPAVAKYQKNLQFGLDSLIKFLPVLSDVFFSIAFAFTWHSAFGIVFGLLCSAIVEVATSWICVTPRPKLRFRKEVYRAIVSPGKWINIAGIMTYAEQNFDNVIVGRMLGATALGFYQTAFNITSSLIGDIGLTFSQVLLPIYGKIEHDRKRLVRAVLMVFIPAAIVMAIPVVLLNFSIIQSILIFFLKDKWRPMLPLLPYLSIAAWFTGMNLLCNPLFLVTRRYKMMVALYGSNLVLLIILLVVIIPMQGLVGATKAVLVARMLLQPLYIWQARRSLRTRTHVSDQQFATAAVRLE
ncbi:hypothetical protein C5B42_02055 [Candidatus Cerribacteria bacterium 'Amazon FNV 2010 28 9']|uniref:Polysaccharide biosynthesis protein C-terminal domain-containing protein n=1 Tax=Candidatus Cerribacteria bacterium 'Amazon FNV 2010 28 9' TaxID=2081795 RepID=A0A317JRX9_9BACT|nr:MAG: hypothetical protein C5B42_02055 [Candidatus Cerribacteria bacterium 'Amazon FNV 2010 28 9']